MSLSWIVARRRESQLATTAPVLTPPGKPSTWFPGERLVTQAQMFYLLSNMFIQKSVCVIDALYMSFHVIFEVFKFDSNLFIFEMFSHHKFTINIYHFI